MLKAVAVEKSFVTYVLADSSKFGKVSAVTFVPIDEVCIVCDKCGRKMVIKNGRYGKFLACPGYPDCKNTRRIVTETKGECPLCGGKILSKKSKTGKTYYGCEHNPTCGFMSWDEPNGEKCPECGKSLLHKKGKMAKIYCSNPDCGYEAAEKKNG